MKKYLLLALISAASLGVIAYNSFAIVKEEAQQSVFGAPTSVLKVQQGGTGASTLSGCLQGNGTGPITGTGVACGSGGAGGGIGTTTPWTVGNLVMVSSNGSITSIATSTFVNHIFPFNSYGISTSSVTGFTGGLFSTASSSFSGAFRLPALTQGFLYTGSTGLVQTIASSSIQLSWFNNDAGFITSSVASPVSTSTNETAGRLAYWTSTSGTPALLADVATGTIAYPTGLTGTAGRYVVGGNLTIGLDTGYVIPLQSTLDAKLSSYDAWTHPVAGTSATTSLMRFERASTTMLSSGLSYFGATATTTIDGAGNVALPASGTLTVPNLTSALTLTNGSGVFAEYAGTSCTNQFVRSLSALGVATCATVGASDVSLANLTATDSTLTFSGTYTGATARTIGLNLGNANTWTVNQTFNYSSSTIYSSFVTSSSTLGLFGGLRVGTTTNAWFNSVSNTVGTTTILGNFANLRASTTANTTQTIDWSTGTFQDIMLTGNTSIVMNATSSSPIDGGMYKVRICQDGTGSHTLTWANPIPLRWTKGTTTITSTANKCTFIGFIFSRTNGNAIYSGVASSTNVDIR